MAGDDSGSSGGMSGPRRTRRSFLATAGQTAAGATLLNALTGQSAEADQVPVTRLAVPVRSAKLHHADRPTCVVAVSPDGAISGGDSMRVRKWVIEQVNGQWGADKPKSYNHRTNTKISYVAVALNCKPQLLFSAGYDGNVNVLPLDDFNSLPTQFPDHKGAEVWVVTVLQDGSWALSATNAGEIRLWDVKANKTIGIAATGERVGGLAFVNGRKFLVGDGAGNMVLYDIKDGDNNPYPYNLDEDTTFSYSHGNLHPVNSVAVYGNTAVSGGLDMTVRIWNLQAGALVGKPLQHPNWVWRVAISPLGNFIATACEDTGVRVFNIDGSNYGGEEKVKYDANGVMGVAFLDEDTVLFTSTDPKGEVKVWKWKA